MISVGLFEAGGAGRVKDKPEISSFSNFRPRTSPRLPRMQGDAQKE